LGKERTKGVKDLKGYLKRLCQLEVLYFPNKKAEVSMPLHKRTAYSFFWITPIPTRCMYKHTDYYISNIITPCIIASIVLSVKQKNHKRTPEIDLFGSSQPQKKTV